MFLKLKYSYIVYLAVGLSVLVKAQDTQYWNIAYGTNASLLGGTVIGSATDISATYYNPGMLGINKNDEIIIGAKMFEYSTFSANTKLLEPLNLSSSNFRPSPTFVGVSYASDSTKANRLSFSLLTRQYFNFSIEARVVSDLTGENYPVNEYAGELIFKQDMIEMWGGVTWSRKINNNVGIGATLYLAARSQEKRQQVDFNGISIDDKIQLYKTVRNYYYYNMRALAKAGVGFNFTPLTFGFTITTPSLNLLGDGEAYFSNAVSFDEYHGGEEINYMAAHYQDELNATYKNSWAIGFGGGYEIGRSRLHLSAEWYAPISEYNVLEPDEFQSQTTGETFQNNLSHEAKSVFNIGVGYQFDFVEGISGFTSIVTDYSSVIENSVSNLGVADWNIYHFTIGGTFGFANSLITAGFEYSIGNDDGTLLIGDKTYTPEVFTGFSNSINGKYNRYKIIIVLAIEL